MKPAIALLALLLCALAPALAGGPEAEFRDARIDAVERTPAGWVVVVTGEVNIPAPVPSDEKQHFVTLYADKATLQVPIGNQLYALRNPRAYEARLRAAVGTTDTIQIWGAVVTLRGGVVKDITAGDISLLRPRGKEAAFDLGKLGEISTK